MVSSNGNRTFGLGILGVQILASRLFFREAISPTQRIGMAVIIGGIVLVQK
jgi:multidrug transporter EmrE-like cation transporter